jgi:hypothetical protein
MKWKNLSGKGRFSSFNEVQFPKIFLIPGGLQINAVTVRFGKKGIVFEIITGSPLFPF